MDRFEGKVALVTGAGTGIGRATVERLEREGASVVAGVYTESQLASPPSADIHLLDVTHEAGWDRVMAHTQSTYGGLDVLVNNAGMIGFGAVDELGDELWERVIAVNLTSVMRGCRRAVPMMRRRGGGAIVNVASINSIRGNHRTVAYSASKGGVYAMTMAMALDHTADDIRVNCVCPGSIDTEMIHTMIDSAADPEAMHAAIVAKHPIGRLAAPEEVASLIAFLASDDASFMTGMAIPVDGGRSIR